MSEGRVKVLIGPSSFAAQSAAPRETLEAAGCEVIDNPYGRKLTPAELAGLLAGGVEAILAGLETLDRAVLEGSQLRVISRCGSGMSNVDLKAAEELGIQVYSTPDAPTTAVAELTVGALLSLLRELPAKDRGVREGRWDKRPGSQLAGKTVAVVGLGRIGRRVAALLGAFGTRVLGVDPFCASAPEGIELVALVVALPLLVFVGDVAGILGGMTVGAWQLDISPTLFLSRLHAVLPLSYVLVGLAKAPVFAATVTMIACRMGFRVARDARSVGENTTSTVVQSIVWVIVLDAVFAVVFHKLGV